MPPDTALAAFVDVETTGFAAWDEVIEFSAALFSFDRGNGAILQVLEHYTGLREPSCEISPGAAAVNGLSLPMLRGRRLDDAVIRRLLRAAELIVAHNAEFDRRFVCALFPEFAAKPWGCSMRHIAWWREGCSDRKLGTLLEHHGIATTGAHRAAVDVLNSVTLLSRSGRDGHPYFAQILRRGRFAAI